MSSKPNNKAASNATEDIAVSLWRYWFVIIALALAAIVLLARIAQLQVVDKSFLIGQGDARTLRVEEIVAHRGMIADRNGDPLAVSTPVETIWFNPNKLEIDAAGTKLLAQTLGVSNKWLTRKIEQNSGREFAYLKRQIRPAVAAKVKALKIPGVHSLREYKRFYPAGEVASHVVGFVNIDEMGQEGIELTYDEWLQGIPGQKKVLKDRKGRIVKDLALLNDAQPGKDIKLTLDMRLQYLAYRELKAVAKAHHARSASLVMLDAKTAEVLAMVNQPSYNPNNRENIRPSSLRNRAITDLFEPGSTVKPLTIAAALETGKYAPATAIDTSPGYFRIGRKTIRDHRNYGVIDIATVISKSSNVGTSKVALAITGEKVWDLMYRVGFGQGIGVGFPGESVGTLPHPVRWKPLQVATMSYGYGLNVTALQLAQAYQVLANDGVKVPASLLKAGELEQGIPSVDAQAAIQVRKMMKKVIQKGGTGTRAQMVAYDVAGKTGTVHSIGAHGYEDSEYTSLFAGMVPVEQPRIVMVIVVDGPQGDEYYGGEVAAPVFSRVATGAMRILHVTPDERPVMAESREKLEKLLSESG
ncbi:peptidoglycan D,D-transpeptidase FtsI family protein [Oleiphilus messinensis]|nr:penicillin-binding protein 2 [Oleiphilus messinensis]